MSRISQRAADRKAAYERAILKAARSYKRAQAAELRAVTAHGPRQLIDDCSARRRFAVSMLLATITAGP